MNEMAFVGVDSMNDGGLGWLAGPFANGDEAEVWREQFIAATQYDDEFVYIVWSTTPETVLKEHTS